MSTCINKIPVKHDPLPPVPKEWSAWECVTDLQGYQNAPWTRLQEDGSWHPSTNFNPLIHVSLYRGSICIRAVKHPAKPERVRKAKQSVRAHSRKSRIATAYQQAKQTDVSAWDFAAQVETIIDNANRSKRRKAGRK